MSAWEAVGERFGASVSPALVEIFEDPLAVDRLPFRLWLPESWAPLEEVARGEGHEGPFETELPLVVIGERTDRADEVDYDRGFMASQGVFFCLTPRAWSADPIPLFRWQRGEPPKRVQTSLWRMPQIQTIQADRWLRTAKQRR